MKRKHSLVSKATITTNSSIVSASLFSSAPLIFGSGKVTGTSAGSSVFLVSISRLLIPFFILISTTCCTTTNSLSPLGLYKVGIGATNLVDNILGNVNVKSDIVQVDNTDTKHTSDIGNQNRNKHSNHKSTNKRSNKTKTSITNKKKRRDKNKNSTKRINSETKKKSTKEKGKAKTNTKPTHSQKKATQANSGGKVGSTENNSDTKNTPERDKDMLRIPGLSEEDQKFLDRVQSSARTVQNWDADEELLRECRTLIPWEELIEGTNGNDESKYSNFETDRLLRASGGFDSLGGADSNALFLQRLCRWFQSFMSWVNAPPCSVCGSKETEMKTVRGPETEEEKAGEAKRVEVYYCAACDDNTTTFPRYNKAAKLLETRKGRCGEYANLFGLFCRAVGFETRLVLDWSDHLWTEVRLGDNWIMADACEGVIDKPSMYEDGWGKDSLCYMVGIGRDHVVDVTPRYTRQFLTDDFQTRRRAHTKSEETSEMILEKLNEYMTRHPVNLTSSRVAELARRRRLEDAELRHYKQATEWTDQEKYGSGRISGSLAWRRSRQEAGSSGNRSNATTPTTESRNREIAGFPVEAFVPARLKQGKASFRLRSHPASRHDGIIVSDTPCAVGVAKSVSVVVLDNNVKTFGCILQSKSFLDWERVVEFIDDLPSGRIVLMNGIIEIGNETKPEDFYKEVEIDRLGGWNGLNVAKDGVLFAGQIDANPDWTVCQTLKVANGKKNDCSVTYEGEIQAEDSEEETEGMNAGCRLRTERSLFPQRIAGRLPETFMSLSRQQGSATEKEKREAYLKFAQSHGGRYCGYCTKKDSPVYLLDSTAYPLQNSESVSADILGNDQAWNTFLELPEPLVPKADCGIDDGPSDSSSPIYDVPLDSGFFNSSLGPQLLSGGDRREDTAEALSNTRLIGLYFSAHWCGPCRSFTPMLAEMYDFLHETYPTHGLEIVFVSSDRDEPSFKQYYQSMPWKAIPFDQLQVVKQALNITYGVQGIPSFVVLDAVSGQVVVPASESRQEVVTACRGGDLRIKAMFQSWLGRTPAPTQELLSMLELSTLEIEEGNEEGGSDKDPDKNPYLSRVVDASVSNHNQEELSVRIKAEFEKLVNAGHDPNSAAAQALKTVSASPHASSSGTPGKLSGRSALVGKKSGPNPDDEIDRALVYALERNSAATVSDCLCIARKYLENSQRTPWEPRFRRFKLSNKVADQITRVEGGLRLVQSLGFEVIGTNRDFEGSIPLAANLGTMNTKMTQLIEDLNEEAATP